MRRNFPRATRIFLSRPVAQMDRFEDLIAEKEKLGTNESILFPERILYSVRTTGTSFVRIRLSSHR